MIHHLKEHCDEVYSIDFSKDEKFVVSGSKDKTIKIFNTETGE